MIINKRNGISLIALVITIIVIIILSGAVILSLVDNNPIGQASQAVYKNDIKNFQSELELYKLDKFLNVRGNYDSSLLQADETSVTYDGIVDTNKTIESIIPSITQKKEYNGQFQVVDGNLAYVGLDTNKQKWSIGIGIDVVMVGEPKVTILTPSKTLAGPGTNIIYTIKFSSNVGLTNIDLTNKVQLIDNNEIVLTTQPIIEIGTLSGTSSDTIREVDVTIKTDNLVNGTYKIKINPGVVTNENNVSNTLKTISISSFVIDSTAPENPLMSASPTGWTNGNVTISITYSDDSMTKEYSYDSTTWQEYIDPVVVTENNTTIYARGTDNVENESGLATLTVANIDKINPTLSVTSSEKTTSSITINASASDAGSGLNISSYQYSKDDGLTWSAATSDVSYIFSGLTTNTYNFKVKILDNAGNETISSTLSVSTQTIGTILMNASPTGWTNGNVTVTITYPAEIVTKQFSLDGTTWSLYVGAIAVNAEVIRTVYARGYDVGDNQTSQASITIANVDLNPPMVTFGTNGDNNYLTQVSTTVTISDSASGVNASTLKYVWDIQNVVAPSSGWNTFTNGSTISKTGDGVYYLWISANDNVENNIITKSNQFIVGDAVIPVSTMRTYNAKFDGSTSGFIYNDPVIPAGFIAVNTEEAKWTNMSNDWNKGLVIQDQYGNQFVWVPVDGNNVKYEKWCLSVYPYTNTTDDELPSWFNDTNIKTTYKGFYIARFESMFDYNSGNIRVASKKSIDRTTINWSSSRDAAHNGYLWNWINYIDSKFYAENMYIHYGYDTNKVTTNLITGSEWDTTMKWIQNSGVNVVDSRTWGNYWDSISPANIAGYQSLNTSGYSKVWRVKNINNLAGNAWEWSNEKYSNYYVIRGGFYGNEGAIYAAATRNLVENKAEANYYFSFRVALYIK